MGNVSTYNNAASAAAASATAAAASAAAAAGFAGTMLSFDGVHVGTEQLDAYDTTGLGTAVAYVETLRCYYDLDKSNGSADGLNRVAAVGGGFWVRRVVQQPYFQSVVSWHVDFAAGDNENDGESAITAVKNFSEIATRTVGTVLGHTVVITLHGDGDPDEKCTFDWLPAVSGQLQILGTLPSAFYTGSLTSAPNVAVTASLPVTGESARYKITDSAIPTSYTASGFLADGVIVKFTHSAAQAWAWPYLDRGSKVLQISIPTNVTDNPGDQPANGGDDVSLSNGDAYSAYVLPKLYGVSWAVNLPVMCQLVNRKSSNGCAASWTKRTISKLMSFDGGYTIRGSSYNMNCAAHGEVGLTDTDAHPGAGALARAVSGGMYTVVRMSDALAMQSGLITTAQSFICQGILLNYGAKLWDVCPYFFDYGSVNMYLYVDSVLGVTKYGGAGNTNTTLFVEAGALFRHGGLASLPDSGIGDTTTPWSIEAAAKTYANITSASGIFVGVNGAHTYAGM